MNTFGSVFRLTSFGESHGRAIGGVIDGCPAGIGVDMAFIQSELDRRKPGQSELTTLRDEEDAVEFLSGVFEGKTTGAPIGFTVWNGNQQSSDYNDLKDKFRPSHADYTWQVKYGIRDYRGGGRSSARETIARVVAGALAKLFLRQHGVTVQAYVSSAGKIGLEKHYTELDLAKTEKHAVRCPDAATARLMDKCIKAAKADGDSVGGTVTCVVQGVPAGWGEPVFHKLHAGLGHAMLGINAVKGFEYGSGFACTGMMGSQHNDEFIVAENGVVTTTNHSGGIQGGISNGQDIYFNVAFKPVATIFKEQQTVNKSGKNVKITSKGRHDACVVPRAVPIVEAMAALVLADHALLSRLNR